MPTRKQLELLNQLDGRIRRDGVAPTYTEKKEALGLTSTASARKMILGWMNVDSSGASLTASARSRW